MGPSEELSSIIEVFYNLTSRVSGSQYVTCNGCFDDITDVGCLLKEWYESPDYQFKEMAKRMKAKCDKY